MSASPAGRAGTRPRSRPRPRRHRPPQPLARAFAELFCEVEAGRRPRRHLAPLMDPVLFVRLAPVWVRPGPVAVVVAVEGRQAGASFDAVALLQRGPRVGALCLRLELGPAGWRVVEAARPEDGALPEPDLDPSDAELEAYAQVVDR